jgi:hypothetical protein
MAPQFDLIYLQRLYAPAEVAERIKHISEFLESHSDAISCVPIGALISTAAETESIDSLNVPRVLLRIAACCCAAVNTDALEHTSLQEHAVACAAHILSAAATFHAAATTTGGKRRRSNPFKGYRPSIVGELWSHVKLTLNSNSESCDSLLLLLAQAATHMLPFTPSSESQEVIDLMIECLSVQESDSRMCWMYPHSSSWLVSALLSANEHVIVQLLQATARHAVQHAAVCCALGRELKRLMKGNSTCTRTSKMITTLLHAVTAAEEATGLSTLLGIAPPCVLASCCKFKAATVRKACCGCLCAVLKTYFHTPGAAVASFHAVGSSNGAAHVTDHMHDAFASHPESVQPPKQGKGTLHHLAIWALQHIVSMATNDKDVNVRLSISHQIARLLADAYTNTVGTGKTIFLTLVQALGQLVNDASAKVHAAATKDLCGLLNGCNSASTTTLSTPAKHVRRLMMSVF